MRISNPIFHDMFWQNYDVEYLVENLERQELQSVTFWDDVVFIHEATNKIAKYAGVSITPFDENGCLLVRGENHT